MMLVQIQFNIIYIMRTNVESDGIRRFVVMIVLVAESALKALTPVQAPPTLIIS